MSAVPLTRIHLPNVPLPSGIRVPSLDVTRNGVPFLVAFGDGISLNVPIAKAKWQFSAEDIPRLYENLIIAQEWFNLSTVQAKYPEDVRSAILGAAIAELKPK
jgi:hypothetical protein